MFATVGVPSLMLTVQTIDTGGHALPEAILDDVARGGRRG